MLKGAESSAARAVVRITKKSQRGVHSFRGVPSAANTKYGTGGRSSVSGVIACVFGATGFLGRHVVNRLARVGSQVVVPYRGDSMDTRHLKVGGDLGQVTMVGLNPRDPSSIQRAVKNCNVVINLAGIKNETMNWSYEDTHVHLARFIAEAAAKEGAEQHIYFSHINASPNSSSKLARSKYAGEQAVKHAYPTTTIIRPATVVGTNDQVMNLAGRMICHLKVYPLLNEGRRRVQYVMARDVASGVMAVLDKPECLGRTFNFVGPRVWSDIEFATFVHAVLRQELYTRNVPEFLWRIAAEVLKLLQFKKTAWVSPGTLELMKLDEVHDPASNIQTLSDLGVMIQGIEREALTILRRFRPSYLYYEPMDETIIQRMAVGDNPQASRKE